MAQVNTGEAWYASITIDADSAKFLASCVVAAVFLLGFAYSNEYFKSFGLSLAELDLSYAHIIGRGVYLFQDWLMLFRLASCHWHLLVGVLGRTTFP